MTKGKSFALLLFTFIFLWGSGGFAKEAATQETYDFRKIKWGMTIEEIKKAESELVPTTQVIRNGDGIKFLLYNIMVEGEEAHLMYFFNKQNKLNTAGYSFKKEFGSHELFMHLKNIVISIIGKPQSKKEFTEGEKEIWVTKKSRVVLERNRFSDNGIITLTYYDRKIPPGEI